MTDFVLFGRGESPEAEGLPRLAESGVFHIWHILSSVAQRQNVVNFHKLVCS